MNPIGDEVLCPYCGYDNDAPYDKSHRKPGTMVADRYLVGGMIRQNGEGITYIGYDNNLQVRVWIREYYPHTIACRDRLTGNVSAREGFEAQFKALMSDFVDVCNDVKRMEITEPVIPIENVFADHGTACAIYKDLDVTPLETWLNDRGGKLPVAEARDLLLPLFNTLSNIHARGVIHRAISPYTVYIDPDGNLYLWDFCLSATRTGGSELAAELFDGYSAPEQYSINGWQGSWTDVYSAAALFYRLVSGFVPPKSTTINNQHPLPSLFDLVMDMPQNISEAVMDAMHPVAELRTQEMGPFISQLVRTDFESTAIYDVNKVQEVKQRQERRRQEKEEKMRQGKYVGLGLLIMLILLVIAFFVLAKTIIPENILGHGSSQSEASQDPVEDEEDTSEKQLPNLLDMDIDQVRSEYGSTYKIETKEEYHDTAPTGQVIEQSPEAGTTIMEGRTIIVTISKGKKMATMPDLVGKTEEEVNELLAALSKELEFDITYTPYINYAAIEVDPGTVVSTDPKAEMEFDPKNTAIRIFFSPNATEIDNTPVSSDTSSTSSRRRSSSSRTSVDDFLQDWYD